MRHLFNFLISGIRQTKHLEQLKKLFPSCSFEKGILIKGPLKNMSLGKNVIIQSHVHIHLGGMAWCENQGSLKIGKNSCISPQVIIYATGPGGVEIGENFNCGPGSKIFSSHSDIKEKGNLIFKKVTIGDNVILFANVVISPGVTIGANSVVYAGAVVNEDIPANTIYGGVPAKKISDL